jgi:hypothetical protein
MRGRQRLGAGFLLLTLVAGLATGCARSQPRERVWIPPRIDLARYGTFGMLDFSSTAGPGVGRLASREFLASLQSAQPGTPVLELGDASRVLGDLDGGALDPAAIRAIGERHRVDALVVGSLDAQPTPPSVAFDSGARWVTASTELAGGLDARIFDTRTGATVWSTSARASEPLARVDVSMRGVSGLGSSPADDAQLRLVRNLVSRATSDFRGYWD